MEKEDVEVRLLDQDQNQKQLQNDARLLGRVAKMSDRGRWPLTDEDRRRLKCAAVGIATDDKCDPRARVAAIKVMIDADEINMAQEKIDRSGDSIQVDVRSLGVTLTGEQLRMMTNEELEAHIKRLESGRG